MKKTVYVKYSFKDNPTHWVVYAHTKGNNRETLVCGSEHYVWKRYEIFNPDEARRFCHIKYLTEQEVDLLKLELL